MDLLSCVRRAALLRLPMILGSGSLIGLAALLRLATILGSGLHFYLLRCVRLAALLTLTGLHHCVVIFFWSSGIMECICMLFTFENGVPLMR